VNAAARQGADILRCVPLRPEAVEKLRQQALTLNLASNLKFGYQGPRWTPEQIKLLGTAPDDDVAKQVGRTIGAVRVMRTRLGITDFGQHYWSAEQIASLGTDSDKEIAKLLGRSPQAVASKRRALKIRLIKRPKS
jgi:hypothetical protein